MINKQWINDDGYVFQELIDDNDISLRVTDFLPEYMNGFDRTFNIADKDILDVIYEFSELNNWSEVRIIGYWR